MDFGNNLSKTYRLGTASVQNVAYALSEYLDAKQNMITQTMRTKGGYSVQCKGDANAEWTRFIGLDAAVNINLIPMGDELVVEIGTGRWIEKLGIAAVGSLMFTPLLVTSGIGAIRQLALPNDIFNFISNYLGAEPVQPEKRMPERKVCPVCGKENELDSLFCSACGSKFEEPEEQPAEPEPQIDVCPTCGYSLSGTETFCPKCGTKITH